MPWVRLRLNPEGYQNPVTSSEVLVPSQYPLDKDLIVFLSLLWY